MSLEAQGKVLQLGRRTTMEGAIHQAKHLKLTILGNPLVDDRIADEYLWRSEQFLYPVWAGPMTAYVQPGTSFKQANRRDNGAYVVYVDKKTRTSYRFPVPREFRSAKDRILATATGFDSKGNPNFELHSDPWRRSSFDHYSIYVPNEDQIHLLPFNTMEEGWSMVDDTFGLPNNNPVPKLSRSVIERSKNIRHYGRIEKRIGLVVRGLEFKPNWYQQLVLISNGMYEQAATAMRFCVGLIHEPSETFNVLLHQPES